MAPQVPVPPAHPGRDDDRRVEKRRETDHTRNANGEEEQDASKRLEQIARCSQSLKDVRAYECLADVRREPANRRDERNAVRDLGQQMDRQNGKDVPRPVPPRRQKQSREQQRIRRPHQRHRQLTRCQEQSDLRAKPIRRRRQERANHRSSG